jgi:hypothetical protein
MSGGGSRALARRSIPVVVPAPTQLSLPLLWVHPIDRAATPEPTPIAPVVALRRVA